MAEKLKKMALPGVMVLDFIAELPQLLRSADIVISKAGGLTAAETLAIGTEFILYDPLPGQEVRNAGYLCEKCEAKIAATPQEVCGFVKKICRTWHGRKKTACGAGAGRLTANLTRQTQWQILY